MNKYIPALLASASLLGLPLRAAEPTAPAPASALNLPAPKTFPFPQEGSDLKPDPAARFGMLPNGLRYVIMPNHEPKGRVSLRLVVLAGSLYETEEQRGLAHFLEHMAFNGSTHYEPGTLVEFLMRMGMKFGTDTNASTGFDRTLYLLELAHTDEKTLAEGLRIFSDYGSGLLLLDDQINKERGIILSEKRVRDSVGYRTMVAEMEATLGDSLIPKRLPIGLTEVINGAQRAQFADFWNTWYRPERLAVVIVGDFPDAGPIEKMVKETYSDMKPRAAAKPEPSLGEVAKFDGVRAFFHAEKEAPAANISISTMTPYKRELDTAARQLKLLPRSLAVNMLNRRLAILAKKENAPFISAEVSVDEQFNFMREAGVELTSKPEQWKEALTAGEQELRRALEHGFSADELKEAEANTINDLEQAVKGESTRRSSELAVQIAQSLVDGQVFTSPADDLALLKPALAKLTPADCLEALRSAFAANGRYVMVSGNVEIPGDAAAAIGDAYKKSQAVAVAAPAAEKQAEWAYTNFGKPGKVAKREHVADLDLELITFENGVRLNIKKTDFQAGSIGLSARVGNGMVTEPTGKRGLTSFAGATFHAGGLGKHSIDDLQHILAGKNVDLQFRPAADAFTFSGDTTKDDLLLEMQYLAAELTDAGYRPEAMREARKGLEQLYLSFDHTSRGPLSTEVANLLANGDPRFGLPEKKVMLERNLDEVKAWLSPQLAHGALEVSLIGDLDVDAAIDAASKTIGALPAREKKPDLASLEKVSFPAKPFAKDYTIASEIQKGQLQLYWPTSDGLDIKRRRRLTLLSVIFSDRLRVSVREKIGGTYSPQAASNASETYPGYGYMVAGIDVDPAMAAKISDLVVNVADDLANKGVTEDELNRARLPLLTALKDSLRNNGYWLGTVLMAAQEKPEMLDWARNRLEDINSITIDDLNKLAKEYLGRGTVSRATILPAPVKTPDDTKNAPAPSQPSTEQK